MGAFFWNKPDPRFPNGLHRCPSEVLTSRVPRGTRQFPQRRYPVKCKLLLSCLHTETKLCRNSDLTLSYFQQFPQFHRHFMKQRASGSPGEGTLSSSSWKLRDGANLLFREAFSRLGRNSSGSGTKPLQENGKKKNLEFLPGSLTHSGKKPAPKRRQTSCCFNLIYREVTDRHLVEVLPREIL